MKSIKAMLRLGKVMPFLDRQLYACVGSKGIRQENNKDKVPVFISVHGDQVQALDAHLLEVKQL